MSLSLDAITKTIPISKFNQGKAGKIFEEVKKTGGKVVIKNNIPEAVILSPEEYADLIEQLEDYKLLATAEERMKNYTPDNVISQEEMEKHLGISEKDLENVEDLEFE